MNVLQRILLIASVFTLLHVPATLATAFKPVPNHQEAEQSKQSQFITHALLSAAGVEPQKKQRKKSLPVPPKPTPKPTPKPAPQPVPTPQPPEPDWDDMDMDMDTDMSFDDFQSGIETSFDNTQDQWQQEYQQTTQRWDKAYQQFLKNLDGYKKALVDPKTLAADHSDIPMANTPVPTQSASYAAGSYHILPRALDLPVRDQKRRPTCAAFTGIRAIESLLVQHGIRQDLSEQYFYWSSKPKCQQRPCSSPGSSFNTGLVYSQRASRANIPAETSCPYNAKPIPNNETQTPINPSCANGSTKVKSFHRIKPQAIRAELDNNRPVLSGFTLTPNFYKTKGFVSYADSLKKGKTDRHAIGHAILLVGYINLPSRYHAKEGKYCLVTANSWSEGWGRGGHACLSQRWVEKNSIFHSALTGVETSTY